MGGGRAAAQCWQTRNSGRPLPALGAHLSDTPRWRAESSGLQLLTQHQDLLGRHRRRRPDGDGGAAGARRPGRHQGGLQPAQRGVWVGWGWVQAELRHIAPGSAPIQPGCSNVPQGPLSHLAAALRRALAVHIAGPEAHKAGRGGHPGRGRSPGGVQPGVARDHHVRRGHCAPELVAIKGKSRSLPGLTLKCRDERVPAAALVWPSFRFLASHRRQPS